jgi:hypothetical protein
MTARVRRIERKLNALLRHHGVDPTQGLPLSARVKQLADDPSRKIEAIKVYRSRSPNIYGITRKDLTSRCVGRYDHHLAQTVVLELLQHSW